MRAQLDDMKLLTALRSTRTRWMSSAVLPSCTQLTAVMPRPSASSLKLGRIPNPDSSRPVSRQPPHIGRPERPAPNGQPAHRIWRQDWRGQPRGPDSTAFGGRLSESRVCKDPARTWRRYGAYLRQRMHATHDGDIAQQPRRSESFVRQAYRPSEQQSVVHYSWPRGSHASSQFSDLTGDWFRINRPVPVSRFWSHWKRLI